MPLKSARFRSERWRALLSSGPVVVLVFACGGAEFGDEGDERRGSSGAQSSAGRGASSPDGGSRLGVGASGGAKALGGSSAAAGGRSSSSSGGQGGSTVGNTPVSLDVCVSYVRATCAWSERCDSYLYGGSREACESIAETSCAWYQLSGVSITDADLEACVAGFEEASCDRGSGCDFPGGSRGNGFSCVSAMQCKSAYCKTTTSRCGICAPDPRHDVGGACENAVLDCKAELHCVDHVCATGSQEGGACDAAQPCDFLGVDDGYLVCIDGTCTAVGQRGEPCYAMEGSSATLCGRRTGCSSGNVCVEAEDAEDGDVCGSFEDRVITCPDGACVADAGVPGTSHCVDWAKAGEDCRKVLNYERCATGLECRNSVCVFPRFDPPPTDCTG